mgnify:CR=1 FL=1
MFLPEEDKYSYSHQSILDRICGLYGGRIAEELIYGKKGVTTGASNDIEGTNRSNEAAWPQRTATPEDFTHSKQGSDKRIR